MQHPIQQPGQQGLPPLWHCLNREGHYHAVVVRSAASVEFFVIDRENPAEGWHTILAGAWGPPPNHAFQLNITYVEGGVPSENVLGFMRDYALSLAYQGVFDVVALTGALTEEYEGELSLDWLKAHPDGSYYHWEALEKLVDALAQDTPGYADPLFGLPRMSSIGEDRAATIFHGMLEYSAYCGLSEDMVILFINGRLRLAGEIADYLARMLLNFF